MGIKRLQCLFIGPKSKLYVDFLELLTELNLNVQVKQTGLKSAHIAYSLKKCRDACLVVISDKVSFSLGELSDLVWRYSSDSIIVIVTNKTATTSLKKPFNTTQISKLFLEKESEESSLFLQYLVQYVQLKADFRHCKRLLGISEKRSYRMLGSSKKAIAYTSRNMHLHANTAYLSLFKIESVENLQRTPVQGFVKEDEWDLYKNYIDQQLRHPSIDSSLIISMKKANGLGFRAHLFVTPTIFKGNKCLQLWVSPVNKNLSESSDKESNVDNLRKVDGKKAESKLTKKIKEDVVVSASSILRDILNRKEATISVEKLKVMSRDRQPSIDHFMISLKIKVAHKNDISNLLAQSKDAKSAVDQIIFWDKVKLTKLIQLLLKKKLDKKLYIGISEEAIKNNEFMEWLIRGIKKVGKKSSKLVFLMPYKLNKNGVNISFKYFNQLRACGCEIAFDDFSISTEHLTGLKHYKPEYIRLSNTWVNKIMGSDSREVALGSLVRQFESKRIKIIAPCGLNKESRRLFTLSGASFCLEKLI